MDILRFTIKKKTDTGDREISPSIVYVQIETLQKGCKPCKTSGLFKYFISVHIHAAVLFCAVFQTNYNKYLV